MTLSSALQNLHQQGYKRTKLRGFLFDFLSKHKKPFTALELQEAAKRNIGPYHKTTIYRELEFLTNNKALAKVFFADGVIRYELADLPHHHHLVCRNCQAVEDVTVNNELKNLEKTISRKKSFLVESHSLEFFGLCKACHN